MRNDIRFVIGALMVMPMTTLAQSWPSRTIRFIAPFPPGGGTDLNARMIAPRLAAALGQPVVVENRPGAGGMLGTDIIAKSPPDGYNMVIATIGPIAINPSLYSKMPYDPVKDLAPVTFSGEVPNGLVVHPTLPVKTVRELIALAKKRSATFWNRLVLLTSTPTVKGASRIESAYEESDQRKFFVKCQHCDESFVMEWNHVQWEDNNPKTAAII